MALFCMMMRTFLENCPCTVIYPIVMYKPACLNVPFSFFGMYENIHTYYIYFIFFTVINYVDDSFKFISD